MNPVYERQVRLLLRILPEIARERALALHGGTAINLFYHEMPRLSVDIDLTWLPHGNREADLASIRETLERIRNDTRRKIAGITAHEPVTDAEEYKMRFTAADGSEVKVEVNTINRGITGTPVMRGLCQRAQEVFGMYCEMQVVPFGQLYGGKIVAALDRQHPRDLFDIHQLFTEAGYDDDLGAGVLFCLLSSKRPLHELLEPARLDQRRVLETQFGGMTDRFFTYEMFEETREQIIHQVRSRMKDQDRDLLVGFAEGEPEWGSYEYGRFPGVQWKLMNIRRLKQMNPDKHRSQVELLKNVLAQR